MKKNQLAILSAINIFILLIFATSLQRILELQQAKGHTQEVEVKWSTIRQRRCFADYFRTLSAIVGEQKNYEDVPLKGFWLFAEERKKKETSDSAVFVFNFVLHI